MPIVRACRRWLQPRRVDLRSARRSPRFRAPIRKRLALLLCLACLSGCPSAVDHRAKEFNDDGVFLFSKGDYRAARESFEAALTLTPQDAALLYNLGQCQDRLGNSVRAEQYYTQCLETAPKHGQARHAYAALLYRLGRSAEANRMIDDWLQKEPGIADAHALQGWRLRQQHAYPEAMERLQHALSLDPGNRLALTELGILYEETNMPDRALVLYDRVLSRHPDQEEVRDRVRDLKAKGVKRPLPD